METAADHLAWLAEFLGPHFAGAPSGDHTARVRLIEDARGWEAARALGPAGGDAAVFALDSELVSLPCWRGAPRRFFDAGRAAFYDVTAGADVTILSASGNHRARPALMRVVRELATNHAQRRGGLLLHAAALAVGEAGLVVAGPKEAGKTTLLIHALHAGGARYVANDRVLVEPGANPRAHGVPAIVKLRRGTLDLFPAVAARLATTRFETRLTLAEAAAADAAAGPASGVAPDTAAGAASAGSRSITPAQLCRLLDRPAQAECPVSVVVFPRQTDRPGGAEVRPLAPAEVAARLRGALFGVPTGRPVSDVFTLPADPPPPAPALLAAGCDALAAAVRGVECRLGLDAYARPGAAGDLLAALLA